VTAPWLRGTAAGVELRVLVQQADDLGVEPAPQATSQN
jgi:hypothetical protein